MECSQKWEEVRSTGWGRQRRGPTRTAMASDNLRGRPKAEISPTEARRGRSSFPWGGQSLERDCCRKEDMTLGPLAPFTGGQFLERDSAGSCPGPALSVAGKMSAQVTTQALGWCITPPIRVYALLTSIRVHIILTSVKVNITPYFIPCYKSTKLRF